MNKNTSKKIGLIIIITFYIVMLVLITFFKRTKFSTFEGRNTKKFPEVSITNLLSGKFASEFSDWFNDTVPYRDALLSFYTKFRKYKGIETEVRLVKNKNLDNFEDMMVNNDDIENVSTESNVIKENNRFTKDKNEIVYNDIDDADLNMISGGAIFYGKGKNIRAMYSRSKFKESDKTYAESINEYARKYKDKNIYVMMVPTQVAYYCPVQYKKYAENAKGLIDNMLPYFDNEVKVVDVYNALKEHTDEDIFLRTDHHWAPLGGYYAAEEFSHIAGVDFKTLDNFEKKEIEKFVGTLYKFTGEQVLADNPETFTYYVPKGVEYTTLQMYYKLDESGEPVSHSNFKIDEFFHENLAKPQTAYLVFMGGDTNTTYVKTNNNTGRNLIIFKDSFGNVVPSNLFYSFDSVVVVDYRYFIDDLDEFMNNCDITDILFINNIDGCRDDKAAARFRNLMNNKMK